MLLISLLLLLQGSESLGPLETVYIPAFGSYCEGQKILAGEKAGEYTVLRVLQPIVYDGGFLNWLNATRASYGLRPVSYDQNLTAWADQNNQQQMARGMGHFISGPARRQNVAMSVNPGAAWMASAPHRAALLDPTITFIGFAAAGAYYTFNAR